MQEWALCAWRMRRVRPSWPPLSPPENAFGQYEQIGLYVGRLARRNRALHEQTLRFVDSLAEMVAPATAPEALPQRGEVLA